MAPAASPPLLEKSAQTRTPRRCARERVTTLMYADLGPGNGGFPINLSEDGMAFQGIRPLVIGQQLRITLKLDGINEKFSAAARVVWLTENGKGGGLQFLDLTESSRQLIRDWIALQEQAGGPKAGRPPAIPPIRARGARTRPAAIDRPNSAVQARPGTTSTPRIQNAGAVRRASSVPVRTTDPAIAPDLRRQEKPVPETRMSSQQSAGLLGMRPVRQILPMPARNGNQRPTSSIKIAGLGFVIAGAGLLIFAAVRHPLDGSAPLQFLHNLTERPASRTAPRPATARAPLPVATAEPSRDLAMDELVPLPLAANAQESLVMLLAPRATNPAPTHPAEKPMKPASKIAPVVAPKLVAFPAVSVQRMAPANPPVHLEQPIAAPPPMPNPVAATGQLRGAATAPEQPGPLAAKPQAKLPETATRITGTVEIIPDLYPSIRIPAGSKGQVPRPGTSLRIGRLYSKIEPAYPQEALRQHIAGTVKVHLLIGPKGTVEQAEIEGGPALLGETVLHDVRQWLYEPTMVGTQAIEVEEDIAFVFRIANFSPAAN